MSGFVSSEGQQKTTLEIMQIMPRVKHLGTRQREVMNRLLVRLLRDDSGVTSLRHFVATVALALAAAAASRPVAGVLASFLYRIHIIATLARP
jgi:hypothetical protein